METMKAVQIHEYGGPEVLKYEHVQKPEVAPDEVLIRVRAAAINPLDVKVRQGMRKDTLRHELPLILGWDLAGVVEAVGADARRLNIGDEVYSRPDTTRNGDYAEYIVVREAEAALKPRSLDFINAAAIPLAALTAWQALFDQANLEAGQTVLIHGAAGGVGHYAVQFAKWKGARVIGTAAESDMDFVRDLGADEVIDYKKDRFEEKVKDVDVVLDVIGGDTQKRSWQVLKEGGILVSTVGIQSPEMAQEMGVQGKGFMARPDADQLTEIAALVDEGTVKPVVYAVLPLQEAAKGQEMLSSGGVQGKIVLQVE